MSNSTGAAALLQWCQNQSAKYEPKVKISGWTTSWQDGLAFCALLHRFHPSKIHFDDLSHDEPRKNLELAFAVAAELGIHSLLSPEEVLTDPKEFSIITYVSQYYYTFTDIVGSVLGSNQTKVEAITYNNASESGHEQEAKPEKREELRRLLLVAMEDVHFRIFDIELALDFVDTVEKVLADRALTEKVIKISKILTEYPMPKDQEYNSSRSFEQSSMHPKLVQFHNHLARVFWEIRTKLYFMHDLAVETSSLSQLIKYGKALRFVKKELEDVRLSSADILPGLPNSGSDTLREMFLEKERNFHSASATTTATPEETNAILEGILEEEASHDVDELLSDKSKLTNFMKELSASAALDEDTDKDLTPKQRRHRKSIRASWNQVEDHIDFMDQLGLPCVLDAESEEALRAVKRKRRQILKEKEKERKARVPFLADLLNNGLPVEDDGPPEWYGETTKIRKSFEAGGTGGTTSTTSTMSTTSTASSTSSDEDDDGGTRVIKKPLGFQSKQPQKDGYGSPVMSGNRAASPPTNSHFHEEKAKKKMLIQRSMIFTKLVVKRGYLTISADKLKSWYYRYFELDSLVLTYFTSQQEKKKESFILLENILAIKTADYETRHRYSFQIITAARSYYLYATTADELDSWLSILTPLYKSVQRRLKLQTSKFEVDGTMVLTVIFPVLQETKRMKFDVDSTAEEAMNVILEKFKNSILRARMEGTLSDLQLWHSKRGSWLDPERLLGDTLKTQDVIEVKCKDKELMKEELSGYLWKRDPRGIVKTWKRRFFFLKSSKVFYCVTEKDRAKPIGFIDLTNSCAVRWLPQINDHVFSIVTNERTYLLQGDAIEDVQRWVGGLKEVHAKVVSPDNSSWIRDILQSEKEGYLFKRGNLNKTWKKRWFFMREGFVHYFLVKPGGGKERRGTIALYESRIEATSEETPNSQLGFQIVTQDRVYTLYGESNQETKEWMDAARAHKRGIELRVNSIFVFE